MYEIVTLSSSNGGLLQHLLANEKVGYRVEKVIVDRKCGAETVAYSYGREVAYWDKQKDPEGYSLSHLLGNPQLIVSVGFLSKVPPLVISRFANKIINSHPSLLPQFGGVGMYGFRVHRAVLSSGEAFSGCTVHFMNNEIDKGDIILQESIRILKSDDEYTLGKRVHELEKECLLSVITNFMSAQSDN